LQGGGSTRAVYSYSLFKSSQVKSKYRDYVHSHRERYDPTGNVSPQGRGIWRDPAAGVTPWEELVEVATHAAERGKGGVGPWHRAGVEYS
jgi:hypothetical protein